MATDWEKKLTDLISETDLNISSLKRNMAPKYRSPRISSFNNKADEEEASKFLPLSSTWKTPSKTLFGNDSIVNKKFADRFGDELENHSPLVASMSKKLNDLEMKFGSLNKTVATLQYENKMQNEEIKHLKGELKHVSKRMGEKGVHLSTESKMKEWQQEMRSEIDVINKQIKSRKFPDDNFGVHDKSIVSLSRELKESKRHFQDEADAARRETDNMRTRILKLENDVASVISEVHETAADINRLKKEIRSTNGRQSNSNGFTDIRNDFTYVKKEISEIRNKIETFEDELRRSYPYKDEAQQNDRTKQRRKKDLNASQRGQFGEKDRKDKSKTAISVAEELDVSILTTELDDLSYSSSILLSDDDYLSSLAEEKESRNTYNDDFIQWTSEQKSETFSDYGDIF